MLAPAEVVQYYVEAGAKKAAAPGLKLLLLGILAGFLIGMGAAVTNTAAHAMDNVGLARMVSGLLFPFGLSIVILTGAELFTGNCMIPVCVAEKKTCCLSMLRNWFWVYLGNFIGAGLLAAACAFSGQLGYSDGYLAVYTMKVAAAKCSLEFWPAVALGFLCNMLVCLGVLCSFAARDATGRILGAYIPVAFFVICGFEHSVANMFYIPAGIFASYIPEYAAQAAALGVQSTFAWSEFIVNNLIPVTIGNIIAGAAVIMLLWTAHLRKAG